MGLVTVIMPCFDHETFVAQAMKSVFLQSYPDIEFLIIDDHSADGTFDEIQRVARNKRFSSRFRRLLITRNDRNMGAHETLNIGLAAASGKYVTFLNSDDLYEPERLCALIGQHSSADPFYLAFSAVRLIDRYGATIGHHELKHVLELSPQHFAAEMPSLSFAFLRYQLTGSTGNIFVSRSLLNEIGGFAPLKYCHDWEFMLRAITITEPCRVPETTYRYRIHETNSFSVLQDIAAQETTRTLTSYYRRVLDNKVRNASAPTPVNWPYVFEMIARFFGAYDAWVQEASYRPKYTQRHVRQ
jgi:glycosyltransferase involved in cell wall biosynthesis